MKKKRKKKKFRKYWNRSNSVLVAFVEKGRPSSSGRSVWSSEDEAGTKKKIYIPVLCV